MTLQRKNKAFQIVQAAPHVAIALVLVAVVAALSVRTGLISFIPGLLAVAACFALTLLLIPVVLVLLFVPGLRATRNRLALSLLLLLPSAAQAVHMLITALHVPTIHDITTDLQEPPHFEAAARRRHSGDNSLNIDPAVIDLQRRAYPDLDGLRIAAQQREVFDAADGLARATGWEVYRSDAGRGEIEAEATTFWFGFKDDVIIRVRKVPDGTRVDMRSASRVGLGDLGANAERIREFLAALNEKFAAR